LKILITGFGSIGKRHLENITNGKNNQIIIWTKRKNLEFKKKKYQSF
jgi:lactate dehydrogenase-like 2-hydroxyacid dehydrogenase